jgi:hypothetical protein
MLRLRGGAVAHPSRLREETLRSSLFSAVRSAMRRKNYQIGLTHKRLNLFRQLVRRFDLTKAVFPQIAFGERPKPASKPGGGPQKTKAPSRRFPAGRFELS